MKEEVDKYGIRLISGEGGGGVLAFHSRSARPSVRCPGVLRPLREFESAMCLMGKPLTDDDSRLAQRLGDLPVQAVAQNALVALRMLEALRDGDAGYFDRLAEEIREKKREQEPELQDDDLLRWSIALAAEEAGGRAPRVDEVAKAYASLRSNNGGGSASDGDANKLKRKLERIGFGWLPMRGRGRPKG